MLDVYDMTGLAGVACSTYCYARVQWQRDFAKTFSYSTLNFFACALMFVSLSRRWNLSSFVSNLVWALISLYGIYRCAKYVYRNRRKPSANTSPV